MPAYIAQPRSDLPPGWATGDKVRTTDDYAAQFPEQPREGKIVGGSRTPGCCRIVLGQHRSPIRLSFDYLVRAPQ